MARIYLEVLTSRQCKYILLMKSPSIKKKLLSYRLMIVLVFLLFISVP